MNEESNERIREPLDVLLRRRDVLRWGAAGIVTLVGMGGKRTQGALLVEHFAPVIVSTPALEEGPFWIDETKKAFHRTDLRPNTNGTHPQSGLPLQLGLTLSHVSNGVVTPLPHAYVYLWHCNADGAYSGEEQNRTASSDFLRGYQVTDSAGKVGFTSIYPGWYGGRTVHIHARVRVYPNNDSTKRPTYDFETQFFFDDAITEQVFRNVAPYSERNQGRDTVNDNDHVYTGGSLDGNGIRSNAGKRTALHLKKQPSNVAASLALVLNLDLRQHSGGGGGFRGGPPPGSGGPGGLGGPDDDGFPPPPPPNGGDGFPPPPPPDN